MIRWYDSPETLKSLGWPPRIIISMNIYDDIFERGFNEHYSLDSNIVECCEHFFRIMKNSYPNAKIDLTRSRLEIRYCDLPKE